jgi:hypothetical protein
LGGASGQRGRAGLCRRRRRTARLCAAAATRWLGWAGPRPHAFRCCPAGPGGGRCCCCCCCCCWHPCRAPPPPPRLPGARARTLSMCGKRNSRPECMPVPRPMDERMPRPTHQVTYRNHSCRARGRDRRGGGGVRGASRASALGGPCCRSLQPGGALAPRSPGACRLPPDELPPGCCRGRAVQLRAWQLQAVASHLWAPRSRPRPPPSGQSCPLRSPAFWQRHNTPAPAARGRASPGEWPQSAPRRARRRRRSRQTNRASAAARARA